MSEPGLEELGIPPEYFCSAGDNFYWCAASKSWIGSLLKGITYIPFVTCKGYTDAKEVKETVLLREPVAPDWQYVGMQVFPKRPSKCYCLMQPQVWSERNFDQDLSVSQALSHVSTANFLDLWKSINVAYSGAPIAAVCKGKEISRNPGSLSYDDALRAILCRIYGNHLILVGNCKPEALEKLRLFTQEGFLSDHRLANVPKPACILEHRNLFCVVFPQIPEHTLADVLRFSPAALSKTNAKPLFVVYQILQAMKSLQEHGCCSGDVAAQDVYVNRRLWISLVPRMKENITEAHLGASADADDDTPKAGEHEWHDYPPPADLILADEDVIKKKHLGEMVELWASGRVSNYDYLMYLNHLAGRRMGDARCHPIFPWVIDFSSPSGKSRDLSKSKFRLNKGDRQLDMTYEVSSFHQRGDHANDDLSEQNVHHPHHVTELLSEITYYVYKARRMPKAVLCRHVRSNWVPAEYPSSIQRMYEWSPDECIPEFFTDPDIFKSVHEDLGDLEIPSWASCPEDLVDKHRQALESNHVSERLHHWIDLTFGYKLSGNAAVKAKNVCLSLVDGHTHLTCSGVVQLFCTPHPPKMVASPYFGPNPPAKTIKVQQRLKRKKMEEPTASPSRAVSEDQTVSDSEESNPDGAGASLLARSKSHSSLNDDSASAGSREEEHAEPAEIISMPKDYAPLQALQQFETMYDFVHRLWLPKPDASHKPPPRPTRNLKHLIQRRRGADMESLACLILEVFLPMKFRCFPPDCHDSRVYVARQIVKNEKHLVPYCIRQAVETLLGRNSSDREEKDTSKGIIPKSIMEAVSGLPPLSPFLMLQPTVSPLPFPEYFPKVFKLLKDFEETEEILGELRLASYEPKILREMEDKIAEFQIKTLASHLTEILPMLMSPSAREGVELLWPVIDRVFRDKRRRVMAAWHLIDLIGRAVGPQLASKHLLRPLVDMFDAEDDSVTVKHMKLFHHSFLLQLSMRLGAKRFLTHFVTCLVEAVGGNKEFDDDADSDSIRKHRHLTPRKSTKKDVPKKSNADANQEVFSMDEDLAGGKTSSTFDSSNGEDIYGDPNEVRARKLKNRRLDSAGTATPSITMLSSSVPESSFLDSRKDSEAGNKSGQDSGERSTRQKAPLKRVGLNISDVAAASTVWLAERIGPVLTARYLTRNLLRMLTLCYLDEDSLANLPHQAGPGGALMFGPTAPNADTYLGAAFTGRSVKGDVSAKKVLDCLSAISSMYGEHFIIRQYLPHAAELLFSSQRKLSPSLEAGCIGCVSLLHHIVPHLKDATLMEHLQTRILNGVLYPVFQMCVSTKLRFPHGAEGRSVLTWKALDVVYLISSRMGMEMTKKYLTPCLKKFFSGFDTAFSPGSRMDSDYAAITASSSGEPASSSSLEESGYFDVCKEGSGYAVSGLVHIEKPIGTPEEAAPVCETPAPGGVSPQLDQRILEEIAGCFTQEMAHLSYVAFCHLSGHLHLERHLKNEPLIRRLCEDFEKYVLINPHRKSQKTSGALDDSPVPMAASTPPAPPLRQASVAGVVGNRIRIEGEAANREQASRTQKAPAEDWDPPPDDRLRKKVESTERHLKGNWLAFWENQVGRSDRDCELDLKQIALQWFVGHTASVRQIYVLDNENSMLSSSKDKTVKLWSLRNQGDGTTQIGPRWSYNEHRKGVNGLTYMDRVGHVVSCDSSSLHVWDPFLGAIIAQVDASGGGAAVEVGIQGGQKNPPLTTMAALPPASIIAATTDGVLRMFDTRTCQYANTLKVSPFPSGMIRCMAVSSDNNHVCVGHSSGALSLLDLRMGSLISAWKGHDQEVLQIAAYGNKAFLTSSMDQTLAVWSAEDAKLRFHMRSFQEPIQCLSVCGPQVVCGTTGNRLGIHESLDPSASCSSAKLKSDICKGNLTALTVLPLNGLFLIGTESGGITLLA